LQASSNQVASGSGSKRRHEPETDDESDGGQMGLSREYIGPAMKKAKVTASADRTTQGGVTKGKGKGKGKEVLVEIVKRPVVSRKAAEQKR
jgi:hypothetical protein